MGVGVGVHPARDGACLYDGQRHPFLWLRDGTHPLATRTREPRPLAQARRIRPAAPVGATNLGPAGRSYPKTARSASAESEVRPDPGHRPYARITPEPRRQRLSTIHILPPDSGAMTPAALELASSRRAANYGHRFRPEGSRSQWPVGSRPGPHPGYGAGLAAEQEAGPHAMFGCGPALAW